MSYINNSKIKTKHSFFVATNLIFIAFLLVSPSKQVIRVGETAKLTCVVIKNGAAIQGFQTVWLKNTSQEWFSERVKSL